MREKLREARVSELEQQQEITGRVRKSKSQLSGSFFGQKKMRDEKRGGSDENIYLSALEDLFVTQKHAG